MQKSTLPRRTVLSDLTTLSFLASFAVHPDLQIARSVDLAICMLPVKPCLFPTPQCFGIGIFPYTSTLARGPTDQSTQSLAAFVYSKKCHSFISRFSPRFLVL